ncbi:MAG TPA: protein kinase [Byssovorax sp.]|jgi:serine/threonine-protein kinase
MVERTTEGAVEVGAADELARGTNVGRYRVERLLGRGGMGAVYAAEDVVLGRRVALKVITLGAAVEGSRADEAKARLLREARAAASLDHPNVVAIYDVGEHDGAPFFAMELVAGASLRERMGEPATVEEKRRWLVDVAEALAAAHDKGIVHRDIKPENVIIKPDGRAKVLDFGIARRPAIAVDPIAQTAAQGDGLGTITAAGAIIGTPLYMSPEQLHGGEIDGRSDQFSWAVVAYEVFAGHPPWEGRDAVALIANVLAKDAPPLGDAAPTTVARVVERALAKSPAARFGSMRDLLGGLDPAENVPPLEVTSRRRRGLIAGASVALLVAAAVLVARFAATSSHPAPPPLGASSAASASVSPSTPADGPGIAVTDLPLPRSNVPEALTAFKTGMQAFRDGASERAARAFAEARRLDPAMGAAFIPRAPPIGASPDDIAELVQQALDRRASLSEHDALHLDAFAPCAQGRAGDDRWCIERFRALTRRMPRDAETWFWLSFRLNVGGRMADSLAAARRAAELDPRFAPALVNQSWGNMYLGDFAAARRAIESCLAVGPSPDCLGARAELEVQLGEGSHLETTANEMLGLGASSVATGASYLASAEACLEQPEAAVRRAMQRRVLAMPEAMQPTEQLMSDVWVAWMSGDFEAVQRANDERADRLEASADLQKYADVATQRVRLAYETGKVADGAAVARAYLDVKSSLRGAATSDDVALGEQCMGIMWLALRRGGKLTKEGLRAERDRYVAEWRPRLGPDYQPFLWVEAYVLAADDAEDAREALEAMPSFGGAPHNFANMLNDGNIGRVYQLAGRVDEAIPWLERAAHACRMPFSVRPIEASLWLGEAREQKGDKSGACEAYSFVLKHWGHAKPKSVTADEAKRRSAALGCAR